MRKQTPPEGPTANELEELMVEQRRRLVAWTPLDPNPEPETLEKPKIARLADARPRARTPP